MRRWVIAGLSVLLVAACASSPTPTPEATAAPTVRSGDETPSSGVFVSTSGSDVAAGTRTAPLRTISHAISVAAVEQQDVYISQGTYRESVALADGVDLHGGYDSTTWTRGPSYQVVINASPIAVLADSITAQLDSLTIDSRGPVEPGQSSYGILARASSLTLRTY
jgi:hypothetical protein